MSITTPSAAPIDEATEPAQYTRLSRILHWATAILIFGTLLIGFTMVSTVGDYGQLRALHETIGVIVLVVVVIRIVNRLTHRPPSLPGTVGKFERLGALGSELTLYGLLIAQPLVGWAMVSATGSPIVVFGTIHLFGIAPVDAELYSILRDVHSVVAYLFVAVIAAHVSAILVHTVTLEDGMLRRMIFRRKKSHSDQ